MLLVKQKWQDKKRKAVFAGVIRTINEGELEKSRR